MNAPGLPDRRPMLEALRLELQARGYRVYHKPAYDSNIYDFLTIREGYVEADIRLNDSNDLYVYSSDESRGEPNYIGPKEFVTNIADPNVDAVEFLERCLAQVFALERFPEHEYHLRS